MVVDLAQPAPGACVPYDFIHAEHTPSGIFAALLNLGVLVVLCRYPPELGGVSLENAALGSVSAFVLTHVLTSEDLFLNTPALLAVLALQITVEALANTGGMDFIVERALFQNKYSRQQVLTRASFAAALLAALVSAPHALQVLAPAIVRIARRTPVAQDALVGAMRQAAHLGAFATLSLANFTLLGLSQYFACESFTGLTLSRVGLPLSLLSLAASLWNTSNAAAGIPSASPTIAEADGLRELSPTPPQLQRTSSASATSSSTRALSRFHTHFTFDALVPVTFNGNTIEEAGFRNLEGLFLTSARRGTATFPVVGPDFTLRTGDRISFAGVATKFLAFCNERGLTPVTENDEESYWLEDYTLEAVVSASSDLVGKSMKRVNFRTRYGASVLAIHRVGQQQVKFPQGKLGQVVLQVGDLLLLVVSDAFDWQKPMTRRDLKPRFATTASTPPYFDSQMPSAREYIFTMRYVAAAETAATVEECGLGEVPGARLIAISRGNLTSKGVSSSFVLQPHDVLWYAGEREGLLHLRRLVVLEDLESLQIKRQGIAPERRALFEAAVGLHSDLLNKTVRESRFGTRFGAVIVAVQRQQEFSRHFTKIGEMELHSGDVLLVDAECQDFAQRFAKDDNFLVISRLENSAPPRLDRWHFVLALLAGIPLAPCFTGVPPALFAMASGSAVLLTGALPQYRAREVANLRCLLRLTSFSALSIALAKTGIAVTVGRAMAYLGMGELAAIAMLSAVRVADFGNSSTATPAALLLLPILVAFAQVLQVDATRMLVALLASTQQVLATRPFCLGVSLAQFLLLLLLPTSIFGFPLLVAGSALLLLACALSRDASLAEYLPVNASALLLPWFEK